MRGVKPTEKGRRDLKAQLVARGMTQMEVAARMGITFVTLSRLLNGHAKWTRYHARGFSFATGIPLAVILPPEGENAA
jgi:transcriptional regulator with XRE-family HTH domain